MPGLPGPELVLQPWSTISEEGCEIESLLGSRLQLGASGKVFKTACLECDVNGLAPRHCEVIV